jgi:PAS domain S-box-containing protein
MSARESEAERNVTGVNTDSASNELADRKRAQALLSAQRRSLQLIAGGASLADVLQDLCDTIDAQAPEIISTIPLMDQDGEKLWPAAGRRVPEGWTQTITPLPIGPQMGSCGTAAFLQKVVITTDIASDPRWCVVEGTDYQKLALSYGLRAAWSYPLISKDDEVLGTFAIYYPEPRSPSDSDLEWIQSAANIAVIAIEGDRSRAALEKAFQDIKKSEAKLRQVIDTIPALAWCNLPDGPNDFLNKRWHEYTGLSSEESNGWGWQKAFHPEDLPLLMERWVKMLASGEPDDIEARLRRHDGVYRWFLIRAEPFRDESGKIVRWYGTSTDIDDRKRAEEALEQAYLRLAQAQRLSKTGSFITDLLADEHNWSEELCRIFDFDPGTRVTTDAIRAVFHPEDLPVYEDAFKRAVDGRDRDIDIIYRIITPSGNVKHLHGVSHVMEKIAGRPVYIGAIQDITESKVAEEALTRARSELAHMARVTMLSALTASIAHEINQPISAVITSADACLRWLNRDKPEVQRARDAAMRISDDGKRAAEIISHLKSFYKKDASPQREVVSVNDVVGEMLVLLRSEAGRHSVVMRAELAADLPSVSADRVQLQQVLMNLMLNGMEAMNEPGGELKISTRRAGGEIMASVSDTGVGIPADKMEQIFDGFFTTKAGGTGMGLAISRAIIESQGGRLWATVNPGRGATFHFTLATEPEA